MHNKVSAPSRDCVYKHVCDSCMWSPGKNGIGVSEIPISMSIFKISIQCKIYQHGVGVNSWLT